MRPPRILALVLAAVVGLLALTACGSGRTIHARQTMGFNKGRLVIDDPGTDLRLVPASGPGLRVQRWVSGTAAKPGHATWTLSGDTLRLSVDCTGLVFHCGARFQVAVPARVAVVVHTSNGDVTGSGLRTPSLRVTSSAGSVSLGFADPPRFVDIQCTDGSATARLPVTGPGYHVVVRSGTGSARTRVPDDRLSRRVVRVISMNGTALVLAGS
jgi:hypothetical protein